MDEEVKAVGVEYCGPVNTGHKGFFLATLEKLTKDWTGGSYLIMKITTRVPGDRPLLAIGYKCNYRKVLNQVIHISLVYLTFILMFLFAPFFIFIC